MVISENSPFDLWDPRGHWVMLTPKRGRIRHAWDQASSRTPSFPHHHHDHQVVGTFEVQIRAISLTHLVTFFQKMQKVLLDQKGDPDFFPRRRSAPAREGALRCSSSGTIGD